MPDIIVQLPLDRTGRSPNNLIGSEEHPLVVTPGFPYKIITLDNGGFYVKSLRVYDAAYNRLKAAVDYIVTYVYKNISESTGLEVAGAIVFLDPVRKGNVFCSAQMVGGDAAFSFTVIPDYVNFFKSKPVNYVPAWLDYVGSEPIWKPGELEKERWGLDTYQPFNNEISNITISITGGNGALEDDFREKVDNDYLEFLARFNDRLDKHIANTDNPHVDTKAQQLIGLGQVVNYPLANASEVALGTTSERYLTPNLSSIAVTTFAINPLNNHIADYNNPHDVTISQTGAVTKEEVNTRAADLYLKDERVANANYTNWNNVNNSYTDLFNNFRANIPASNFSGGYLNPVRYGGGSPSSTKALTANGIWTEIESLTEKYAVQSSPTIYYIQVNLQSTPLQAHQIAITQPFANAAPSGSMIFYNLSRTYARGAGYGIIYVTDLVMFGSIKTDAGWAQI